MIHTRAFTGIILWLGLALPALATVPTVVQTVNGTASGSPVSVSITATINNLLIIQIIAKGGDTSCSAVTVGGTAATKITDATTNQEAPRAEAWYYYVTSGSSQSVSATLGGSPTEMRIGVTELSGMVASSPVDVTGSRFYQSSASPTVSMTTTVTDTLLFGIICHKSTSITWGGSQTERWIYSGQGGGSTKSAASSGSQTMSGTIDTANWTAMIAFAIKPLVGGAARQSLTLMGIGE